MWTTKPRRKRQKNPKPSEYPWPLNVRLTDNLDLLIKKAAMRKGLSRSDLVRKILKEALRSGKYA